MRWIISIALVTVVMTVVFCPAAFAQTGLSRVWQDDTGGTAYDVEVSGGWAYVSNNGGVSIYDVRRPSQPRFSSLLGIGGTLRLYVEGSTLYAAAPESGLLIFDVSGGYPIVCVSDGFEGVEVIDGRLPAGENVLAREDSLQPHSLFYWNGYIHVADMIEGYVLLRFDHRPPPLRPSGRRRPVG